MEGCKNKQLIWLVLEILMIVNAVGQINKPAQEPSLKQQTMNTQRSKEDQIQPSPHDIHQPTGKNIVKEPTVMSEVERFQKCFKVNVQRRIDGSGFHRDVVSNVDIFISADDTLKVDIHHCEFILVDELPPGLYVDSDELTRKGKQVVSSVKMNTEQAAWQVEESGGVEVYSYLGTPDAARYSEWSLSYPVHVRYHRPSDSGYVSVNWTVPGVYATCGAHPAPTPAMCGSCKLLPCEAGPCHAVPLPYSLFTQHIAPQSRLIAHTLTVPVARIQHALYVAVGTCLTLLATMAIITLTLLHYQPNLDNKKYN